MEDVAGLLKRREGVGVDHLRPHVAVIGRRIAVAREHVGEMGRPVPHGDLGRHADARERGLLEARDVEILGARLRMDVEIDQRRGQVFDGRKALIEGARIEQPAQQVFGDRLAGVVMQRELAQDFGPLQPMLVELRRQLHPIGEHVGPRYQRIGDVGERARAARDRIRETSVLASSNDSKVDPPSPAFEKFITLMTSGRMSPSSFC